MNKSWKSEEKYSCTFSIINLNSIKMFKKIHLSRNEVKLFVFEGQIFQKEKCSTLNYIDVCMLRTHLLIIILNLSTKQKHIKFNEIEFLFFCN